MKQPERHPMTGQTELAVGIVRLHSQGDYLIETETVKYNGRRASGCLIAPSPGDLVLLAVHSPPQVWILSVLERAEPGRTVISCDEGLTIEAGSPGLVLKGEDIELSASRLIKTTAPEWSLTTARGSVKSQDFSFLSQTVSGAVGRLRLWAEVLESKVGRLIERVGRSFRVVKGLDKLIAGKVRTDVRETWDLHAESARILAADKVKVDAGKIDLG